MVQSVDHPTWAWGMIPWFWSLSLELGSMPTVLNLLGILAPCPSPTHALMYVHVLSLS